MKPEAIQNERDRIGSTKRNRKTSRQSNDPRTSSSNLLLASSSYSGEGVGTIIALNSNCGGATSPLTTISPDRNSESDESVTQLPAIQFASVAGAFASSSGVSGAASTSVSQSSVEAARQLIRTLVEIDTQLSGIFNGHAEITEMPRQRVVRYLLEWSNVLNPLPSLPFNDKVSEYFVSFIIIF